MKPVVAAALLLMLASGLALTIGVRSVSPVDLWQAVTAFDSNDPVHITLLSIRFPRLCAGIIAGAALGMAGSIMQALTRNPLAEPGLLGVGAGAAVAVVLGALLLGRSDSGFLSVLAFPGAALASVAVFVLGGALQGGVGPVRLVLAGAALNAFLLSFISGLVLLRGDALDIFRFWVNGSLSQAAQRPLAPMAVVALGGAIVALAAAPILETLTLGNALSQGLGTRLRRAQATAILVITLLTGAAVAVAGPIAFLGLAVPPVARRFAGHVLRAELALSALLGAATLILADTIGRIVIAPAEVRVGIMTTLLGGPIFIFMVRRLRLGQQA